MAKSYFYIVMYLVVFWLVSVFVFGKSGILDNVLLSREILKLSQEIQVSHEEIQKMKAEYTRLSQMTDPDHAFLIKQGRILHNALIFKMKENDNQVSNNNIIISYDEKRFFFLSAVAALGMLILGCLCLFLLSFFAMRKRS
ncbi:MAG: FtsB family cell division protein [Brevinemataceae bacterium]